MESKDRNCLIIFNNRFIIEAKGWQILIINLGFTSLIAFSISFLFLSDGIYFQSFSEKLAIDRIEKIVEFSKKWQWVAYVFIPFVILTRAGFTAISIYIGCFVADIKIHFRKLFKIALLADFVFVIAGIAKLVILIFFKKVSTLSDLQFQPLSLMELFNKNSIEPLLIYPFSLINTFEILYVLILALLLSESSERPFGKSLKIVASSYGTGLFIWVILIMFLIVTHT